MLGAVFTIERGHRFLHKFEYTEYTKGASKCRLHLYSQTIQAIGEKNLPPGAQFGKVKLAWHKSTCVHWSLGWIPLKFSALSYRDDQLWISGLETEETHVEAGAKPRCVCGIVTA